MKVWAFCNLHVFNTTPLARWLWLFMYDKGSLVMQLNARYFSDYTVLQADFNHHSNLTWHSLKGVQWVTQEDLRWRVGDSLSLDSFQAPTCFGNERSFWEEKNVRNKVQSIWFSYRSTPRWWRKYLLLQIIPYTRLFGIFYQMESSSQNAYQFVM